MLNLVALYERILWSSAGKGQSAWLSTCTVLLYVVLCVFVSRLVSGAGYAIRSKWFLNIAFSTTFYV